MITETIEKIIAIDGRFSEQAQRRLDSLTKPQGSLGRLEEIARRLVEITEEPMPAIGKKIIFTFAGDHGVTEEGISAYPKEVTPQMVFNFLRGGAAINVLARHAGAEVSVVDAGVDYDFGVVEGLIDRKVMRGTRNMTKGPAMSRDEAIRCIEVGIALANECISGKGGSATPIPQGAVPPVTVATGDMGIGNTTPSSAIAAVMTGRSVAEVTGRGTGITDETLKHKISVIEKAIAVNKPDPKDALDVLAKVGGCEIGAIAGLCLGAAANRLPVVIDGFISTAGALIAYGLEPNVKDYMFSAHMSQEVGHRAMLDAMGLTPILDLDLRLGEGTGAALAMTVIEAALKIYTEMATFGEAGVSEKK